MSVVIEFNQIEKHNVLSENKIFGLYEVSLDKIEWKRGCFLNATILQKLHDDANSWGEVYNQPFINKFLFYLLAVDTEMGISTRTENEESIISAFAPCTIKEFLIAAKQYTIYGKEGRFDELLGLVEEAIENELLIVSRIS